MTSPPRLFELRTYQAAPGKLAALEDRFRHHTLALFAKHGITVVGFWTPEETVGKTTDTLIYLLAFSDRDAAEVAWTAFQHDPAWIATKETSERQGPLTAKIDSVFLTPTEYSPLS